MDDLNELAEVICPLGICDGSGIQVIGRFDDEREETCPCSEDDEAPE